MTQLPLLPPHLADQIDYTSACWLWTGPTNPKGYGIAPIRDGSSRYAHRQMYALLVGPIPPLWTLDHLCRVTSCVNPSHLQPVTRARNSWRARHPEYVPIKWKESA